MKEFAVDVFFVENSYPLCTHTSNRFASNPSKQKSRPTSETAFLLSQNEKKVNRRPKVTWFLPGWLG